MPVSTHLPGHTHRTNQDPEPLAHPTTAEGVTRNARGESLDDARETFRAEWQARLWANREQSEEARRAEKGWASFRERIFVGGVGFGAYFAGLAGLLTTGLPGVLIGTLAGAVLGWIAVIPLAVLSLACEVWFQRKAERLERDAHDLERS